MQWSADNTVPAIQGKSLKLRELFAKIANSSLAKGLSKDEAIFAGTNAVKIEERKNQPIKVKQPKLPSHVESLRSYTNPFEVLSKAEESIFTNSTIKSSEFDKDGRLVLNMSDGKKVTSKNTIVEQNIEQNIAIAPNVQIISSDESLTVEQDGQIFDISTSAVINTVDHLDFNQLTESTGAVGRLKWNDVDGTLEFGLKGGNVTLQIGQEQVVHILNNTAKNFSDLQVLRITGASGQRMTGALAQANSEITSSTTFAIVTEPILKNQIGFATTSGLVRDVDTSDFNEGDALYLSPSVAGGITNIKPVAPDHMVLVGWCVRSNKNNGQIYVHVQNGYELEELHNVKINNVTDGQVLAWNSSTNLWENKTVSSSGSSNSYFVKVNTTANTAITITHNLNLLDKDAFVINTMLSGSQVQSSVSSINNNSLSITTSVNTTNLAVTIFGIS